MYIVINHTKQTRTVIEGSWPNLEKELERGDKIIVISLYSNTIKVPYLNELNGINEWEWVSYDLIKTHN